MCWFTIETMGPWWWWLQCDDNPTCWNGGSHVSQIWNNKKTLAAGCPENGFVGRKTKHFETIHGKAGIQVGYVKHTYIYIYIQNNKHLCWYVSCTCFLTIDFGRFACWFSYGNYLHVCAMYSCCVCWTSTTTCWQGLVCWTYLPVAIYKPVKSILDVLVCFLAFVKLHKLHVLSCWSFLTLRGYLNLRMCNQVEIM